MSSGTSLVEKQARVSKRTNDRWAVYATIVSLLLATVGVMYHFFVADRVLKANDGYWRKDAQARDFVRYVIPLTTLFLSLYPTKVFMLTPLFAVLSGNKSNQWILRARMGKLFLLLVMISSAIVLPSYMMWKRASSADGDVSRDDKVYAVGMLLAGASLLFLMNLTLIGRYLITGTLTSVVRGQVAGVAMGATGTSLVYSLSRMVR